MKVLENRRINTEKVRRLCVENNWYECGDNREYAYMFEMVREGNLKGMPTQCIFDIAEDIYVHSDFVDYMARYDCDENYVLSEICGKLASAATVTFFIED